MIIADTPRVALMLIMVTFATLTLLPTVADGSPGPRDPESVCEFTRSLEKPFKRIQFQRRMAMMRKAGGDDEGEPARMYGAVVKVALSRNEDAEMDEMSLLCLDCHDGAYATGREIRFLSRAKRKSGGGIDRVHGGHPIGMAYAELAFKGDGLRRPDQLNPDIILVAGKVGCLSCHNPLNPKGHHMTVSTEHSALCLSCHNK